MIDTEKLIAKLEEMAADREDKILPGCVGYDEIEPLREAIAKLRTHPDNQPNDELTEEQLRRMVGKWVWVEIRYEHCATSGWALVATGTLLGYLEQMLNIEDCGTKFTAHLRPPAGEAVTRVVSIPEDEKETGLCLHTTHEVKTLPEYFWPQVTGRKPFDVRRDDRGYQVGDILRQREWTPTAATPGRSWTLRSPMCCVTQSTSRRATRCWD